MNPDGDPETIQLLRLAADGDVNARDQAWARVYDEVLRVAAAQRRRWSGNWTMETRVLASEVFIKLYGGRTPEVDDRKHFFTLVARAIRQILVNYSEGQRTAKRGGDAPHGSLTEFGGISLTCEASDQLVDLHEALERFEKIDPRAALVVELRFFGGFSYEEIAEVADISRATAVRDWNAARAWLHRELTDLPELPEFSPPPDASASGGA